MQYSLHYLVVFLELFDDWERYGNLLNIYIYIYIYIYSWMTITSTYFEHLFLASKKFYINRIYIDNTKCEEPSFAFHCRV